MFKGVDQWNVLFEKYRVMDAEDKDPNRFKNNRGGALLKKQKEFKKCKVQLTQLENNLKADIVEWEKDNEKEFQVDGVGFRKYIETQWGAVCESKDMERIVRNQKKKVELAREMVRVIHNQLLLNNFSDLRNNSNKARQFWFNNESC